jgi:signal transduction histidine kinase
LQGGGEMGERIRAFNWDATPLGPPQAWPQALKTLVNLLLASTQPMFLGWGPERTWLYNDAFTPILGRKHPSALGRPSMEVWAEAREVLEPMFDRVFAGEPVSIADFSLGLDREGTIEEAHFEFAYTPARGEDGAVEGLFGACIETTARVMAERRLRELNETLEQRVEDRTRELKRTEEALRQAQKMEAVGQLTGGIAHDFNNLLAGISGSLELLETRLTQGRLAETHRYIAVAQGAARRATILTQRLLAFSRRQTLDPRPTDVNKLVVGMEDLIRRSVGPDVDVAVVGADGLWLTKIDPSQLENSLLNLCINARDAMAPNGGRLIIATANTWLDERAARERDLSPGPYISLSVTDTGSGMAPEVIARAFDPFFTTKPLGEGTGLGLSMVYGFARQSGGQVHIRSEIGKGTTLDLYLPRLIGAADNVDDAPAPLDIERGAGETVLIIDDEPSIRMLIAEVLQELGYTAIEADSGANGLRILQSDTRIDLLITDVGLPGGLNGRQVADAARLVRPDLKVLFITGFAENAVVAGGHLAAGMAVITKPFVLSALGQKVRDLIER